MRSVELDLLGRPGLTCAILRPAWFMQAGGLGLVEEHRHLVSEVRPHDRSEEIDPLDAVERGSVGPGVVPIEMCIGTRAGRGANRQATREQPVRDA